MTNQERLSRGLASAMLAGAWTAPSIRARLVEAIGGDDASRGPLDALVAWVVSRHPTPPRDARDGLARELVAAGVIVRPWTDDEVLDDAPDEATETDDTDPNPPADDLHLDLRGVVLRWWIDLPAMGATPWQVPTIATTGDLAAFLFVTRDRLDALADRRSFEARAGSPYERRYATTFVAKRTGGVRVIEAPSPALKAVQRRIARTILAKIPVHPAASAYVQGRSIVDAAKPHVGAALVLRVDLEDFFGSVHIGRVFGVLRTAGYPEEVARALAALTTRRTPSDVIASLPRATSSTDLERRVRTGARLRTPHLPQGAPTSPTLANLVSYRLDVRLAALAAKVGGAYTRYADDLFFSLRDERAQDADRLHGLIAGIAHDEGFIVATRKSRFLRRHERQQVVGVVVNERLSVAREEIDRLRATLHNCARHGAASQDHAGMGERFRAHLLGRVAAVAHVSPARGAKLRGMFERVEDWGLAGPSRA